MATLYIANPTLQHHQLHVNLTPPVKRGEQVPYQEVRIVDVPARGQAKFPDDLDADTLKRVLQQIETAGGVPETDPKAISARCSLLYKVSDKPIAAGKIETAADVDEAVRQDLGATEIEKAAARAFRPSAELGASEMTMTLTQVTDGTKPTGAPVKGGVDAEVTVSKTKNIEGGRQSTRKA